MKKFKHSVSALISLTLLLSQIKTKDSHLYKSKKRIFEDDFFHVDDFKYNNNVEVRTFGPNQVVDGTDLIHGYIKLQNVDHIAMPNLKLMLSALFFQEIRKPKRVLIIGLGIGIIPRALNFILKDTIHVDVVEIGRI